MQKWISAFAAALLAASLTSAALADNPAGSAKGVDPAAAAALGGATRTLVVGSDVFIGDLVNTGPKGQVQILFADNTKLVVGPQSSLKIDDYLLRNNGDAGKFVVDMLSGSFRFATGDGPKNKYVINTPTGTIGVRGTRFDVWAGIDPVTHQQVTYIMHYLGTVMFKSKHETKWKILHDACTVGRIFDESTVLGSSKTTTGDFRNQLKAEFRYAVNQSPLLRPYWFSQAFECLVKVPDVTVPKGADTTTPIGLPPKVTPPPPPQNNGFR
jgi:hypothetical protein